MMMMMKMDLKLLHFFLSLFFQQNNVCLYKKVSYSNKSFDLSLVNFFCVWTIRTMPFDLIKRFFLILYCSSFVWNFNCKLSNENKTKKLYKRKKWNKVVNLLFDVSVVTLLLLLLGFFIDMGNLVLFWSSTSIFLVSFLKMVIAWMMFIFFSFPILEIPFHSN